MLKRVEGRIEWKLSLDRGIGWRVCGVVNEPEGFVAVITSLLLNKEHREFLGQCRNKKCGRFFVVERGEGKPRTIYCGDDCMLKANAAGSAARQRDRYKRRRAADLLVEGWHGRLPTEESIKSAIRGAFKTDPAATAEQLAKSATALLHSGRRSQK